MFTVETKSMLAKLMATENIKVEHRNCKTAGFNMKTRTLVCPIWKDMSGDLYDLLMGHEISHALRTPLEGWHDSVIYAGGDKKASKEAQKAFKHFLNVVEDARIEKLVKRQYPGLRRPMINGYKDLLARDFFGLSAISNYNELYLIDKLNVAAKCGTLVNIKFSKEEKPFFEELQKLETWDDVVALTRKLYAYSKQEQKEGQKKRQELADHLKEMFEEEDREAGEFEEDEDFEESDDFETEEDEDGEEGEGESEGEGEEDESEESGGDGEDGEDSDKKEGEKEDGKEGSEDGDDKDDDKKDGKQKKAGDKDSKDDKKQEGKDNSVSDGKGHENDNDDKGEFIPRSKTDESFREHEDKLIENSNTESHYINIPNVNLKDAVTPCEIVNKGLSKHYSCNREEGYRLLQEFKKKNEDYISLLAKEFEMKKAARSFAKAKISDSGDININKLAQYRLEDDIFKKMIQVHKGKSHGLVLILDKSGSMHNHIEGAMEQILVMALFCRKVNIPFVAYSFTSGGHGCQQHDFPGRAIYDKDPLKPFSTDPMDMKMGNLELRELFNSKLPASEFTQAMMNHLMLAKGFMDRHRAGVPSHEALGGTPLNEALVVLRDLIRRFKLNHRLDIVNAIVVHDGDSDGNSQAYGENPKSYSYNTIRFCAQSNRVTLVDKKEKLQVSVPRESRGITIALMKWIQMTANCGVFGFYITGGTPREARNGIQGLYQNKEGIKLGYVSRHTAGDTAILLDKLSREVIEQKFLESWTDGYTRFYFIPGAAELRAENDTMTDNGRAWTPSRLLSAFKRVNKRKQVSRVLVNKFIQLIAI